MTPYLLGLAVLFFLFIVLLLAKTVRIVPQARAGIVERFGKYKETLPAGLNVVVPFVDRVRYIIDLREQVVSFPPQPVITEDNLVVSIDTVIYFQVTDPVAATYEIANYIQAIEQLTMTTLRNIVGGMDLEETLTSRDQINRRPARGPRRGHRQVGHPRQPRRDQGHRPAAVDQGLDGEADARRPREARRHPDRRGPAAGGDPHRRGQQAVDDPQRRGRPRVADPAGPGQPRIRHPEGPG